MSGQGTKLVPMTICWRCARARGEALTNSTIGSLLDYLAKRQMLTLQAARDMVRGEVWDVGRVTVPLLFFCGP